MGIITYIYMYWQTIFHNIFGLNGKYLIGTNPGVLLVIFQNLPFFIFQGNFKTHLLSMPLFFLFAIVCKKFVIFLRWFTKIEDFFCDLWLKFKNFFSDHLLKLVTFFFCYHSWSLHIFSCNCLSKFVFIFLQFFDKICNFFPLPPFI